MSNNIAPIFAILAGVFSMLGAIMNWDWFMDNSKARFFVDIFGRTGARLFYAALGGILIGVGLYMTAVPR